MPLLGTQSADGSGLSCSKSLQDERRSLEEREDRLGKESLLPFLGSQPFHYSSL